MDYLTEALEAYKPEIAESFKRVVVASFERMVAAHGPALKGVYNSTNARFWSNTVSRCCKHVSADGSAIVGSARPSDPYAIDDDRLARAADEYAAHVIEAWKDKLAAKLGELERAEVRRMDAGGDLVVTGVRFGRAVRIEQQRVLKVSSKGTIFHQFPARIYVDGKFTSEAAYKRLAA